MNESLTAVRSTDWSCVLSLQSFTLPVRCDSLMRECAVQFVMYFKCLFNMFGTFACSFLGCKVLAADNASKWMKGFSSGTILKESFDFVVLRKLFHNRPQPIRLNLVSPPTFTAVQSSTGFITFELCLLG